MLLSLLKKRRSIRKFQALPVVAEKVDQLVEAMLRSPSSRGYNPWEFVVVTDPSLLKQLSKAKEHGSALLEGAPLAIAVCADPQISDVWIEDCSIAALIIHLAAESLGLGSCWVQIRERRHSKDLSSGDFVRKALALPDSCQVEAIVGIGYPAEKKPPHPRESLLYDKVYSNRYGTRWSMSDPGRRESFIEKVAFAMEDYFGSDDRRIEHAHRVAGYARELLAAIDADETLTLLAAYLHDIGIPEAERKYGSCPGHCQEQEGPPVARALLEKLGADERLIVTVCELVGCHHTPGAIDSPEFRILWDADALVNLVDVVPGKDPEQIERILEKSLVTETGYRRARKLFLS
ncbi:nitroreductase family protein [Trichloromonas sp.]|uniref:nitroreductase family protein n=1 Tax=Trichloromonas sp. TaxID=3069249 RepID=UPI003D81B2AE